MDDRTNDDPAPPAGANCPRHPLPQDLMLAGLEAHVVRVVGRQCALRPAVTVDDATQETALRIVQHGQRFDPQRGSWPAFVTTVARSAAADLDRKVRGRGGVRALACHGDLDGVTAADYRDRLGREPLPDIEHLELHLDVQSALDRLSPRDRRVADLIATNTVREIADQLGVAPSTVKRACVRIRGALTKAGLGLRTNRRGERNS